MQSIIAVTNKHTAKVHHVGSLYILTRLVLDIAHKINIVVDVVSLFYLTNITVGIPFVASRRRRG
jgi:hypothetical protein